MKRNDIIPELQEIFVDVFDNEELIITEETNAEDIEDWDSLEQIHILVAIEKRFNIKFDIKEVTNLNNVGEIVDVIERKIGG